MAYDQETYAPRYDHQHWPQDLVCAAAIDLYQDVAGPGGLYGNLAPSGPFAQATAQTLAEMILEMAAFWTTAQADAIRGGTIKGFSSTSPRNYYNAFPAYKGDYVAAGTGSWDDGSDVTSIETDNWAKGLWSLCEVGGPTQETIVDVWPWLMTFANDPTIQTTANTYDPTVALSFPLIVRTAEGDPTALNGSTDYWIPAMGLLAKIQVANEAAKLDAAKKIFSNVQQVDADPQLFDDLRTYPSCSFDFVTGDRTYLYVTQMAQIGLAYRAGNVFHDTVRF